MSLEFLSLPIFLILASDHFFQKLLDFKKFKLEKREKKYKAPLRNLFFFALALVIDKT